MSKILIPLLMATLICMTARGELENGFEEIPEAGRIRIDGRLEDWEGAIWYTLPVLGPPDRPGRIGHAEWTAAWSDRAVLLVAVRHTLRDPVLADRFAGGTAQDHIELFVRADTGSNPAAYAETQESAQHYRFGLSQNREASWKQLGAFDPFPRHNPARAAVRMDGDLMVYELEIPLFDHFDAQNHRRISVSEVYIGKEIGLALRAVEAGADRTAEEADEIRHDADLIPVRVLAE